MAIKIELREEDFKAVASPEEIKQLTGSVRVLEQRSRPRTAVEIVEDLLPAALVERIRKITPPDFELSEITIDAEVSGKILGTGVSGTFSMKLTKPKQTTESPEPITQV